MWWHRKHQPLALSPQPSGSLSPSQPDVTWEEPYRHMDIPACTFKSLYPWKQKCKGADTCGAQPILRRKNPQNSPPSVPAKRIKAFQISASQVHRTESPWGVEYARFWQPRFLKPIFFLSWRVIAGEGQTRVLSGEEPKTLSSQLVGL